MIFQIKIDRRTLKKNPNAGSTVSYIPGITEATFEYKGKELPNYLKDGGNCIATEVDYENNIIQGRLLQALDNKLFAKMQKDENINVNINREMQELKHLPEPDYFYKYRKTKVQCDECMVWFDHHKLLSDEIMDVYSDRVCPECGSFDCCQLKYESL